MKILRFILPFLFVRNWYDGSWEFSRARLILFLALILLVFIGIVLAYVMQYPVSYTTPAT